MKDESIHVVLLALIMAIRELEEDNHQCDVNSVAVIRSIFRQRLHHEIVR